MNEKGLAGMGQHVAMFTLPPSTALGICPGTSVYVQDLTSAVCASQNRFTQCLPPLRMKEQCLKCWFLLFALLSSLLAVNSFFCSFSSLFTVNFLLWLLCKTSSGGFDF